MSQKSIVSFKSYCERHEYFLLVALLALGLIIRLALIFTVTEPIDRDAKEYLDIAQNIVAGKGFSIDGIHPTARRAPGYPFFLAILIFIFGANPQMLYIFQAIVNIATILLTYFTLKKLNISPLIRLLIVILFTISTTFIYINVLYAEIVTMFFVALLLFIAMPSDFQSRPWLKSIILGILLGVLIYLRPTFLYMPFFLFIGALLIKLFCRAFIVRNYLMVSVVALLTIVPWSLRNYAVFHKFIPLVSAGGSELWGANFEITQRAVWYSVSDIAKYEAQRTASFVRQNKLITQYRTQYNLESPESLNRFLLQQGKAVVLAHPFRYALLCFNRLMIFWFSPPIGSATLKSISPILFIIILLVKYSLTILAIFGLWKFARHDLAGSFIWLALIVYLTMLHSATHSIQRYSLPLVPLVYFAFGYYLDSLNSFKPLRAQRTRRKS